MTSEPNRTIALRLVKREPDAACPAAETVGIAFEAAEETGCPHCGKVLPVANVKPLSRQLCPACGGEITVPGRVGGFLLREYIGEGEMGTIYRATDESLKRDVAIKLVRAGLADNPESRERLRGEACAAGKLNHPRVAQVHALNFSNGHPYLVMELVPGQDFARRLAREGRVGEREALRMALDVAEGLSAINREGLIHGDVKPGNIVLDRDGHSKLVDFGLSGMTRRDSSGALVGSLNYIAPELLRGAADTHSSDLYSLGATLYHLLSGCPPFDDAPPSEAVKTRLSQNPAPLGTHAPHVSAPTRKLVTSLVERDPARRPADSDAVAADIRDALARLDAPKPAPPSAAERLRRLAARLGAAARRRALEPSSPNRILAILVLGLAAVVALQVAFREPSLDRAWGALRRTVSERLAQMAPPPPESAPLLAPPPPAPVLDVLTTEDHRVWHSMNLGERTLRGSTLYMGGTLIVQGAGADMWKGHDGCRFVGTKASGDYTFSAQVKAIADNNNLAVTGLLVKGADPSLRAGLLFGFFGNGELFLQTRQHTNETTIVKRSGRPVRLPAHLKLARRGNAFEASVSADGSEWKPFAACELSLPAGNTVGFSVSAQDADALATAKFAVIRLLTCPPGAVPAPPLPVAAAGR